MFGNSQIHVKLSEISISILSYLAAEVAILEVQEEDLPSG